MQVSCTLTLRRIEIIEPVQVSCTLTLAGFRISEPVQASSIFHKNTANYSAFIEKVGPGGGVVPYIYIHNIICNLVFIDCQESLGTKPSPGLAGSGFVWDSRHVVTNYHVINELQTPLGHGILMATCRPYVTFLQSEKSGALKEDYGFSCLLRPEAALLFGSGCRLGFRKEDSGEKLGLPKSLRVSKDLRKALAGLFQC